MAAASLFPLLLWLLLAASAMAIVQAAFLSIDCGASLPHTDSNGIRWVGDGSYVKGGASRSVANTLGVARELTTLRAFTSRKKNCYTIPVTGGGLILLRARFYYGNYDGKGTPPAFHIILDGNLWESVETTASDVFSYEAIYAVAGESTSACVAQSKPGQVPFVSSVEVRSLPDTMYPNFSRKRRLRTWDRVAYASEKTIIRNLSGNNFDGSVPSSLSQNENVTLDASGNPNLQCSGGSCSSTEKKEGNKTGLIVGVTVSAAGVLLCVAVGLRIYCIRRKETPIPDSIAPADTGATPTGLPPPRFAPTGQLPPLAAAAAAAGGDGISPANHGTEIGKQSDTELEDLTPRPAQQRYEPSRSSEMPPEATLLPGHQARADTPKPPPKRRHR